MDPQATFRRILDAMHDNDSDSFHEAFDDLANWLKRGGFAPAVSDLGWVEQSTAHGERTVRRERIQTAAPHYYAIQTIEPGVLGAYEFVIYNSRGESTKRFPLRIA
jgi:hypothetical protein